MGRVLDLKLDEDHVLELLHAAKLGHTSMEAYVALENELVDLGVDLDRVPKSQPSEEDGQ